MKLVFKFVAFLLLVIFSNICVINAIQNVGYVSCTRIYIILSVDFVMICVYLYLKLFKTLSKLRKALKVIDFNDNTIDFSLLDQLEGKGYKEVIEITDKCKYLLDIIAERIMRVNKVTYTSEHDELSGLYNRVHLDRVKGKYETATNTFVLFIDVNNLKKMNDIFGHEAGDALIRSASAKLKYWESVGDVYRMGGDEFMVVILNKSPNFCMSTLNKWYPTVGQLNRDSDGFKCVLSYGVAYASGGCNFDSLQKKADDEMYKFKVAIKKKFGEPMR